MKKDNELVLMAKNLLTENGYDGEILLEIINSDGNNYQFYEKEELYNELMKVKDNIQNVSGIVQNENLTITKEDLLNFSIDMHKIKKDVDDISKKIQKFYFQILNN